MLRLRYALSRNRIVSSIVDRLSRAPITVIAATYAFGYARKTTLPEAKHHIKDFHCLREREREFFQMSIYIYI